MTSLSVFVDVPDAPILKDVQQEEAFLKDKDGQKVFLGQKVLVSEDGLPWVPLPVKKAYLQIVNDPTRNYEDLPVGGMPEYLRALTELALGKDSKAILENRAGGLQTPGSTGAFQLGIQFLSQSYNVHHKLAVCIGQLDCNYYVEIFEEADITNIYTYRIWNSEKNNLALPEMLEDLETSPDFSIVVLPISCTPYGIQFSDGEWRQLAHVMKKKSMFPFFHLNDQGLASGNLDADAWPLRYFVSEDFEMFCAQSFSTSFGLYGANVGNLLLVMKSNEVLMNVRSQLECLVHGKWSTPAASGARVVATILNNSSLFEEWKESLKMVVTHLVVMREKIRDNLRLLETLRSWDHITKQSGLFIYIGLTSDQVDFLAKKKHIYLPKSGRINISGLNPNNLPYVTQCISDVTLRK
ncbi:aspartate aminotransferase, cytoplasmic-like [Gastrophryne carolinensis]